METTYTIRNSSQYFQLDLSDISNVLSDLKDLGDRERKVMALTQGTEEARNLSINSVKAIADGNTKTSDAVNILLDDFGGKQMKGSGERALKAVGEMKNKLTNQFSKMMSSGSPEELLQALVPAGELSIYPRLDRRLNTIEKQLTV